MNNYQLVLPEHLNHYGYLFGGILLKWVDESAYIAARLDHPHEGFVTVGMDGVSFKKPVDLGDILRFNTKKIHEGKTSITYRVGVHQSNNTESENQEIFHTTITFVAVDKDGNKCSFI